MKLLINYWILNEERLEIDIEVNDLWYIYEIYFLRIKLKHTKKSLFRWQFKTDTHDISFGVFYQPKGDAKKVEVLPMERVNSHWVPEDGTLCAEKRGLCKLGKLI